MLLHRFHQNARYVVLLLLCAFCAWAEVKVFPSKTHNVAQYRTYSWRAPRIFTSKGMEEDDPVYAPLIRNAINRQLAAKGYQEVPQGGQLEVISAGVTSKSSQLEGYLVIFGTDYYSGIYSANAAMPVTRVNHEGTLAVALYDPEAKASIWAGYVQQALGRGGAEGKLNDAAGKLFKKLPKRK